MQIKTIEALNMKEAMVAIKKELGPDAVLLSSKEKQIPGKEQTFVEVTAAAFQPEKTGDRGASASLNVPNLDGKFKEITGHLERIDNRLSATSFTSLEAGISDLKAILLEMLAAEHGNHQKIPASFVKTYYQLKVMGISESLIKKLANQAMRKGANHKNEQNTANQDSDREKQMRERAMQEIYQDLKIHSGIQSDEDRSTIGIFVGNGGVGKTSIITKLASHFKQQKKAVPEIISFRSARIGNDEILHTFSRIIDCKFHAVNSVDDLQNTLSRLRPGAIALVDTPSLSSKNNIEEELLKLAKSPLPIEFHLVASLTEKNMQIDRSIARASKLGLESLCFTKLDEAQTFGEIYNQCSKWSIPLSYFSIGEDASGDLEKATKERVIQKIFGID